LASVVEYDPAADTWSTLPAGLTIARGGCGAVRIGDRMYVMGGDTGTGPTGTLEVYDLDTGTWETGPFDAMNTPRSRFGCTVDPDLGRIYVFGGAGAGGAALTSVEWYDPATDAWTTAAGAMPRPLKGVTALVERGTVKVYGGITTGGLLTDAVYQYYPVSNVWKESAARLPVPACDLAGCTMPVTWTHRGTDQTDEFCFLAGGWDGTACQARFLRFYTR
jgi:N-acetylneuraminic acid mutarotase